MLPAFMLPEIEVSESGAGTAFALEPSPPQQLTLIMGITHILQQHSLELTILGSEDGVTWMYPPLASFSQKFYCGTYQICLDLKGRTNVHYLLPRWKLSRWGRSAEQPLFGVYLRVEPARAQAYAHGASQII